MASIALVYGPKGAGKTSTTLQLAESLSAAGLAVGGFYQRPTRDAQGRPGYDLVRFADRNLFVPLARYGETADESKEANICSFLFATEAFDLGLSWLRQDAVRTSVIVIDEVSKLEVSGKGHAASVHFALSLPPNQVVVLSVRGDQLFYVVERFGIDGNVVADLEIPASPDRLHTVVRDVVARVRT